jgi:hypothetical protein
MKLGHFGKKTRNTWKFLIVALEKDGDHLDLSCKKWRSITESQGGEEYPTNNKKKDE